MRDDLDTIDRRTIADWVDRDLPFVVARNAAGDAADVVRLGLSLPDKIRIGVCLDRNALRALQYPPSLDDARRVAPPAWGGTIDAIQREASRHDVLVRTYGSLAWQAVTALDYVRPTSDLDLLLIAGCWNDVTDLSRRLQALPGPPRLDGEALFSDGSGIAWREIAGTAQTLLVKTPNDVAMVTRADLARSYMAHVA